MDTPLTTEFTKDIEAILRVHRTPEVIISCMQRIDKIEDPIPYLTFDCALCYIVHKNIKDIPQMAPEAIKVLQRIGQNVQEMRRRARSEQDSPQVE
jgi:hypothetical protein